MIEKEATARIKWITELARVIKWLRILHARAKKGLVVYALPVVFFRLLPSFFCFVILCTILFNPHDVWLVH
jgi:hypothetical protein